MGFIQNIQFSRGAQFLLSLLVLLTHLQWSETTRIFNLSSVITTTMSGSASSVLELLADTNPGTFLDCTNSGATVLETIYDRAVEALLTSPGAADEVARLDAVLSIALNHGLGAVVLDYVKQVRSHLTSCLYIFALSKFPAACSSSENCVLCAMPYSFSVNSTVTFQVCFGPASRRDDFTLATASDPASVIGWLSRSLESAKEELYAILSNGLPAFGSAPGLPRQRARLSSLALVADSLGSSSPSRPLMTSSRTARRVLGEIGRWDDGAIGDAHRLLQLARIMEWLGSEELRQTTPFGRFSSYEAWRGTVERRRAGAKPMPLFVLDLMDAVAHYVSCMLVYVSLNLRV